MSAKTKRNIRDAEKRKERLHFKFISNYVEAMHGDVFIEAQELYEHARRKNPKVFDLTKTAEFISVVTPDKEIPRYYKNRRQVCYAQVRDNMSTMVLNIPLIQLQPNGSLPTVAASQPLPPTVPSPPLPAVAASPPLPPTVPSPPLPAVAASPPLPPTVPSPPLPAVAASPPLPPTVPSPPLPAVAASPPLPPTVPSPPLPAVAASPPLSPTVPSPPLPAVAASPPLPPLSSDVYQGLLEDLQKDPDLYRILSDFPVLDNEDMNLGDAFISNDLTPLEIELEMTL